MATVKINWDKLSGDPKDNVTSTRKIEFTRNDGTTGICFRLCLERTDVTDAEVAIGAAKFLYITMFPTTLEAQLMFEKKFEEKKLSGFEYAERRQVKVAPYVRFYSFDSSKGTFKTGDPIMNTAGTLPKVFDTVSVDVLLDKDGKLLVTESQVEATARGNLQNQVDQGWAQYAESYMPLGEQEPDPDAMSTPEETQQQKQQQKQQQQKQQQKQWQGKGNGF